MACTLVVVAVAVAGMVASGVACCVAVGVAEAGHAKAGVEGSRNVHDMSLAGGAQRAQILGAEPGSGAVRARGTILARAGRCLLGLGTVLAWDAHFA